MKRLLTFINYAGVTETTSVSIFRVFAANVQKIMLQKDIRGMLFNYIVISSFNNLFIFKL